MSLLLNRLHRLPHRALSQNTIEHIAVKSLDEHAVLIPNIIIVSGGTNPVVAGLNTQAATPDEAVSVAD